MNKTVSPSRQYVAVCNKLNFNGYYFRRFKLPETASVYGETQTLDNNSQEAASYFLNVLNCTACIDGCIALEDFQTVEDQDELNRQLDQRGVDYANNLAEAKKQCAAGCNHRNPTCKTNQVRF